MMASGERSTSSRARRSSWPARSVAACRSASTWRSPRWMPRAETARKAQPFSVLMDSNWSGVAQEDSRSSETATHSADTAK